MPRIVNLMNAVSTAASTPLPLTSAMTNRPSHRKAVYVETSPPTAKWLLAAPYALPMRAIRQRHVLAAECALQRLRGEAFVFQCAGQTRAPAVKQDRESPNTTSQIMRGRAYC